MNVLGINRVCNWVQIYSDSFRHYTCPTKEIDGELFFIFKKKWHPVAKYLDDNARELVEEDGYLISHLISK